MAWEGTWLGVFIVVRRWHWGEGSCVLAEVWVTWKSLKGTPGFSFQLSQMWGRRRKTKSEVKSVRSNGDSDTERGGDLSKVTKSASGSADERTQASGTGEFSFPSQHRIETTLDRKFSLQAQPPRFVALHGRRRHWGMTGRCRSAARVFLAGAAPGLLGWCLLKIRSGKWLEK